MRNFFKDKILFKILYQLLPKRLTLIIIIASCTGFAGARNPEIFNDINNGRRRFSCDYLSGFASLYDLFGV